MAALSPEQKHRLRLLNYQRGKKNSFGYMLRPTVPN
jgi:hypothetical protein